MQRKMRKVELRALPRKAESGKSVVIALTALVPGPLNVNRNTAAEVTAVAWTTRMDLAREIEVNLSGPVRAVQQYFRT